MPEKRCSAFVVGLLDQIADEFGTAEMYQEDLRNTIDTLRDENEELKAQIRKLELTIQNVEDQRDYWEKYG